LLDSGGDDLLFQICDVMLEVVQMFAVQLLFKIILNTVDSMLLVQLIGQILELSVNSSLFLSLGKSGFVFLTELLIVLLNWTESNLIILVQLYIFLGE
jgi:hypothetical protein